MIHLYKLFKPIFTVIISHIIAYLQLKKFYNKKERKIDKC